MTSPGEPKPTADILPFRKPFNLALLDLIKQYSDLTVVDAVYYLNKAVKVLKEGKPK